MGKMYRFLIINDSSLDVIELHREWLESQGVQVIADPSFMGLHSEQLDPFLVGASAIIGPSSAVRLLPRHIETTPSLQVISLASSGYDWMNVLDVATENGVVVTHAPVEPGSDAVADHALGLMLAVTRQIPYHHQRMQVGDFRREMGTMVWGKTLGIIGLGRIGKALARRAKGMNMKILAAEILPDMDFIRNYGIELVPLDELLQRSDFVSLHVRLNPETKDMIGARELSLMKPSAYLINTARQKLVDQAALADAILNRRIAGAANDDPPDPEDNPLLELPNFVCTPHIGNRAIEGVDAVCRCGYENALAVLQGRWPQFILNPQVYEGSRLRAPHPNSQD